MLRSSITFHFLLDKSPILNEFVIEGDTYTATTIKDIGTDIFNSRLEIIRKNVKKVVFAFEEGSIYTTDFPWDLIEEFVVTRKASSEMSFAVENNQMLKRVDFGTSVQKISGRGFSQSGLSEIEMSNVKYASGPFFHGCHNLKKIVLPLVERIPNNFASYCFSLEYVDISGAKYIESNAFYNCPSLIYLKSEIMLLGSLVTFQLLFQNLLQKLASALSPTRESIQSLFHNHQQHYQADVLKPQTLKA